MPSLNWLTARAEIETILTGVAITSPIAATILRVFQTPPKQASDYPAVLLVGTAKGPPVRSCGMRQRTYVAHIQIIVRDADINRAADIIDALQEAIIDRFDINVTLNGKASNVVGPEWEEPAPIDVGGQTHQGCNGFVTFQMTDDVVFAG